MLKYIYSCVLLTLLHHIAFCADVKYAVASLPDSLKTNADVVKRYEELIIEIKSPSAAKITTRYAYTVFNSEGDGYATFVSYYDKFDDINSISGTLYDALGREIKSVKKKDLQDMSLFNGSLMTDTRYKKHDFYYRAYPYTVEYEQEESQNGLFNLPTWYAQNAAENVGVEYSKLTVIAPKDYKLRYKNLNYKGEPVISETGSKKTYTWEVRNLKPIRKEIYSPSLSETVTSVLLAPSDFEIDGFKGTMNTWLEYGKFINLLNAGRSELPDDIKQQVHTLTDKLAPREKVSVLYDFLQKNSRYISIQLGIGGWQPFDAKFVSSKKYGDCKALSNYMIALLKEAGIKSNYVLIRALRNAKKMDTDFPSNQFNHATVCVPMGKDSIWLECTSQTVAEGYLSFHTDNRKALLVDDEGGHVVFTKKYTSDDNFQVRTINGIVDESGNLNATVNGIYACQEQESLSYMINNLSKKDQLDELKKQFNLPTYDISSFDYIENKQEKPQITERIALVSPNYATVSGKRMFITPNILSRSGSNFKSDTARKFDIQINEPFQNLDSVMLQIPDGYNIESAPKNASFTTQFGTYDARYNIEGNKILYVRKFCRKDGRFPASSYSALADFYNNISKADRSRIVFVKKE